MAMSENQITAMAFQLAQCLKLWGVPKQCAKKIVREMQMRVEEYESIPTVQSVIAHEMREGGDTVQ